MTTRLDRLVLLLDTGSTQLVRHTAASQLADIQRQHPHELYNLLGRVVPYLRAKTWETRVAAAKAVGGIVDNVEGFDPNGEDEEDVEMEDAAKITEVKEEEVTGVIKPADADDYQDASEPKVKQEPLDLPKPPPSKRTPSDLKIDLPPPSLPRKAIDTTLHLSTLSLPQILTRGRKLLGSAGSEYEVSWGDLPPSERLAFQKRNLMGRLGLGSEVMSKEEQEELFGDKDLSTPVPGQQTPRVPFPPSGRMPPPMASPANPSALQTPRLQKDSSTMSAGTGAMQPPTPGSAIGEDGLSARQRNALKRKAKAAGKNASSSSKIRVVDLQGPSAHPLTTPSAETPAGLAEPTPKGLVKQESKGDYFSITPQAQSNKVVVEHKAPPPNPSAALIGSNGQWPFEALVDLLLVDLFDPVWEVRHGASMGLREVLRKHGAGAGRKVGLNRKENNERNKVVLEDLACRVCAVFALDRFGDYISDQVVAPIRESVSQTFGALLQHLPEESVVACFDVLLKLVFQNDPGMGTKVWEVTHGGMLGMKYLVAVRRDIIFSRPALLDGLIRAVVHGLADHDDDVRAVSAATLVPIAEDFIEARPNAVGELIDVVWSCLADLKDDLSASTGSVMDLLAKLCAFPKVLDIMKSRAATDVERGFGVLVPRLYPFLRHTITSVRMAVLRALLTFLGIDGEGTRGWVDAKAVRLIFQNMLVEQNEQILALTLQVWEPMVAILAKENRLVEAMGGQFMPLMTLLMTPIGIARHPIPMETSLFMRPSGQAFYSAVQSQAPNEPAKKKRKMSTKPLVDDIPSTPVPHNVDGPMMAGDVDLVGMDTIIRTRITAAIAMGMAMGAWPKDTVQASFGPYLDASITAPHSTGRLLSMTIIEEYVKLAKEENTFKEGIRPTLGNLLNMAAPGAYSNLFPYLRIVRGQCHALHNTFIQDGKIKPSSVPTIAVVVQGEPEAGPNAFSLEDAEKIVSVEFDKLKKMIKGPDKIMSAKPLADAKASALNAIAEAREAKEKHDVMVFAAAAAAYVAMGQLPAKLNPVIRSIMDSIKKEENTVLQRRSAAAVATLVELCATGGKGAASDKMIKNLCAFLCVDTSETPEFMRHIKLQDVIFSLKKEDREAAMPETGEHEREAREARTKRRGAQAALEEMAERFGMQLFEKAKKLRDCMFEPLSKAFSGPQLPAEISDPQSAFGQEVVDGFSVLKALVSKIHPDLCGSVVQQFPLIIKALEAPYSVIRYAASKSFATVCKTSTIEGMQAVIEKVLPMVSDPHNVKRRQGGMECIYHLVQTMDTEILPYVIFLIVPVLGRMSDADNDVRLVATTTFATLVKLVPLEAGIPDPPGISEDLLKGRDEERKFIAQMLDGSKVEPFELPVAIKADLRKYQQEGVNWLWFLNKYHLHGILCDDMGLGKTLQTICIVTSDHHIRAEKYEKNQAPEFRRLPSLIVAPPTLSGHWKQEIMTYAPFMKPVVYTGLPFERAALRNSLHKYDIVITSYEICRNDIEELSKQNWNYCVLDEGHIIKNAKAKLTQAVKRLKAEHRLILSGTPIQNNVLELWSLFDFLMPGFLGTERVFNERFAKPIAASRDSKSSSKEQEAGALALEALHKQVLPFLLRRLKEDVLADLPPKIIQDYYCELSSVQKQLYEDFAKSQGAEVAGVINEKGKDNKSHVFQALQYMRKLCNHPSLVLNPSHPKYTQVMSQLAAQNSQIKSIEHAPKLGALKDLLQDCGIGVPPSAADPVAAAAGGGVVNQHRALIFCQLKEMLDMVEHDVLKSHLPGVSYMRLDGSIPAPARHEIVQKFNADPSIDVLLLTTHVGGLGLNLTGADTVIFVEHDWNPMKDLQAMDRAHRIGQKKVVNVYRLITRGTLEEKIMGLQRFKLNIASSIVNQQNSGLATMDTDQILDLFNLGETAPAEKRDGDAEGGVDAEGNVVKKGGAKNILDEVPELGAWDEGQYQEEYNLDGFIASLKR
ncbi:hypothetical protein SAICODRAFT_21270 [Saitoella complicata NRRL Y-17804]|uniref:TATA-binding protein-associated factor mot1 n=1 Tax=Saitoella complicata (strain BCRC 22490 / CBS 7301 / JCM 7358 / NBRC 10748 / NRRL Y-17804) TaxID=698492 RepID=A0A0E9NFF9_SAICN|nr:uncharacterized protein SAICODRAFT_21270 [Saitoella complicata NRRL Y-17804]ODQ50923.1 hypothetical protein SAICODRAFT_21270 [Saitoella complicata NRRL Y-17804]GAO48421.1 hypothetical protein G7K_2594-t1 [Saitoella complicata NRRL Y-17804]